MNWKDTRTRRKAIAFVGTAAVVAGGVSLAQYANAVVGLSASPGAAATILDVAAAVTTANVQTITKTGAGSGNFKLTYQGEDTATLTQASTASDVATALNALATITAAGGVTVTMSSTDLAANTNTSTITFVVAGDRTPITITGSTFSGGSSIAIAETTTGGALNQNLANATYAARVTTTTPTNAAVKLESYTAPASGALTPKPQLYVASQAVATTTGPATGWTGLGVGQTGDVATNNTNNWFISANVPGTYTYRFVNDNGTPNASGDDITSDPFTLTVLDVEAVAPTTTADDWVPTITVPATVVQGVGVKASVSLAPLTLVDARSSNATGGLLANYYAALVGVDRTGAGLNTSPASVTWEGTSGYITATPTSAAASPLVSTALFNKDGVGAIVAGDTFASSVSGQTAVTNNQVATITGSGVAKVAGVSTAAGVVKTGSTVVTLQGKAATLNNPYTDKSGKTFYFSITSGTNSPTLTADGTLVSTTGNTKVYTANTDADGVATLKVTSSVTTVNTTFTYSITTNAVAAATGTATWTNAAASDIEWQSTTGDLSPLTSGSATIKGKLIDQFGSAYVPSGAQPQQVLLYIGTAGGATYVVSDFAGGGVTTASATVAVALNNGAFSYTYTPASAPTAGQQTNFTVVYNADGNGTVAAGEALKANTVNWTSNVAAKTVTFTKPTAALTSVNLSTEDGLVVGDNTQVFGSAGSGNDDGEVSGTLLDTNGATIPYRTVTLTATDGVWFSTSSTPDASATPSTGLVKSIDVSTNGSGVFKAFAVFTKPGDMTITAKSGSGPDASATVTVTTDAVNKNNAYKVVAIDATGPTSSTLAFTGKVTDIFGNPVPGEDVNLSVGASTLGVLGASKVTTNSEGVFSTTFVAGSNAGTVTVTATMWDMATPAVYTSTTAATNLKPVAGWATAGITLPNGSYEDTATLTIGSAAPTLTGPASHVAGSVTLSGTAPGGAQVDIYAKKAGSSDAFAWIGSATADGTTGDWSKAVVLSANTTYVAKVGAASSAELTVKVSSSSKVTASAKALGKKVVKISIQGTPKTKGTIVVYIKSGSKWVKVRTWASSATGGGSINVKTSKGSKTFLVYFTPSGGSRASAQVTVTVK